MKTTIEISDALLTEAKQVAARRRTTLRALVEAGLRHELRAGGERQEPFRLKDGSFRGEGMNPEFAEGGWGKIRDAIYEGHGA